MGTSGGPIAKAFIDVWTENIQGDGIRWFAEAVDIEDDTIYAGSIANTKEEAIKQCREEAKKLGVEIVEIVGLADERGS